MKNRLNKLRVTRNQLSGIIAELESIRTRLEPMGISAALPQEGFLGIHDTSTVSSSQAVDEALRAIEFLHNTLEETIREEK